MIDNLLWALLISLVSVSAIIAVCWVADFWQDCTDWEDEE